MVVEGETGTGKEVFARAAHAACARSQKPFVAVNCAALPETLIEAELFGYEPGAFTGAGAPRRQGPAAPSGGRPALPRRDRRHAARLQSRLLRALQEREVLPVGGTRPVPVDFALICATHRDLSRMVEDGAFRADLFYRIAPTGCASPPCATGPTASPWCATSGPGPTARPAA